MVFVLLLFSFPPPHHHLYTKDQRLVVCASFSLSTPRVWGFPRFQAIPVSQRRLDVVSIHGGPGIESETYAENIHLTEAQNKISRSDKVMGISPVFAIFL